MTTWLDLSRLKEGARVRFRHDWDIFPDALIPAGSTGTIREAGLNEIWCAISVRPDDESQAGQLAHWDKCVIFHGPAESVDEDRSWWDESPLEAIQ